MFKMFTQLIELYFMVYFFECLKRLMPWLITSHFLNLYAIILKKLLCLHNLYIFEIGTKNTHFRFNLILRVKFSLRNVNKLV